MENDFYHLKKKNSNFQLSCLLSLSRRNGLAWTYFYKTELKLWYKVEDMKRTWCKIMSNTGAWIMWPAQCLAHCCSSVVFINPGLWICWFWNSEVRQIIPLHYRGNKTLSQDSGNKCYDHFFLTSGTWLHEWNIYFLFLSLKKKKRLTPKGWTNQYKMFLYTFQQTIPDVNILHNHGTTIKTMKWTWT